MAKDIITKYQNVLVINIVRLPIDRNIFAFWQFTKYKHPFYLDKIIEKLNNIFINTRLNIKNNDAPKISNLTTRIDFITDYPYPFFGNYRAIK